MLWKWPKCPNDPRNKRASKFFPSTSEPFSRGGLIHWFAQRSMLYRKGKETEENHSSERSTHFRNLESWCIFAGIVKFFCKDPDSKWFRHCGLLRAPSKLFNAAIITGTPPKTIWAWLCSNKTLFTKTGHGSDLTHRPFASLWIIGSMTAGQRQLQTGVGEEGLNNGVRDCYVH